MSYRLCKYTHISRSDGQRKETSLWLLLNLKTKCGKILKQLFNSPNSISHLTLLQMSIVQCYLAAHKISKLRYFFFLIYTQSPFRGKLVLSTKPSILLKEKYPFENVLTSLIKLFFFCLSFSVALMKYPKTNKTV